MLFFAVKHPSLISTCSASRNALCLKYLLFCKIADMLGTLESQLHVPGYSLRCSGSRTLHQVSLLLTKRVCNPAWCVNARLCINLHKTAMTPFTRKHKLHHLRVIRLHGREVKRETEVKDFGIRLNRKLLCKTHVGNPCQKAASALMTFRFIEGKKWGCTQRYHFGYRLQ